MYNHPLYTYVMDKSRGVVKATVEDLLLNAKTDEDITPDQTYSISGNKMSVKPLDLNCEFVEIQGELNRIAKRFIENF